MPERRHISRGLRFTLTAVYTLVFTLLLSGVSLLFRQTLASSLEQQIRDDLNQNWAALKGYLRIEKSHGFKNHFTVTWYADRNDPDENSIVARLNSVYLLTDDKGSVIQVSPTYQSLGIDSPEEIRRVLRSEQTVWHDKRDPSGVPYRVRGGYVYDEDHTRKFYVAIGRSLAEPHKLLSRFTWLYVGLIPLVILTGCIMGWIIAGRALTPVLEVARTAQRISGSNLSLRIPGRGAGDELDFLIETFNQMIERLESNFNQIRQFSTDVSHELRTPITIIRGQLDVALLTAQTVEQYQDAIVNSLAEIERLSQIVRALLLLSQAETGQVVLQKQSIDLIELIANIVDQFQIPAESAQISLRFDHDAPHCNGEFDRIQIERMLSNLLSNAMKFTHAGGEIRVIAERSESHIEIRVEDTGEGISPEHLPHIFDRFYRVRGPGEQSSPEKGLGLGLSFVAWIVRAHGGTIDVESELGKGTTFIVRLPLSVPAPTLEVPIAQSELMKPV